MIQQISANEFQLVKGAHKMTLSQDKFGWHMVTENACTRAWGSMGFSRYETLAAVEAKYKSWRGIAALVEGA